MKNRSWLVSAGLFVATLFPQAGYAVDEVEFNAKFREMAAQQGITDEAQLNELKRTVRAILETRERFIVMAVQEPCENDIKRFCSSGEPASKILSCIKANREQVTSVCEEALQNELGGKPLAEKQLYHGVWIPKGSTFFYDSSGKILGAITSEDIEYNGIRFRKGQVRFHEVGLSVGSLVADQIINGIKYKADGIGPFFSKDGNVENATLAEDTEIVGILYKGGTQIMFHPATGHVYMGHLAKDATVHGRNYKAGNVVWFNVDGSLQIQ
jgi:hypothetical protein